MQEINALLEDTQLAVLDMVIPFKELYSSVERFLVSLYRQKHAFYFRMVKQWAEFLSVSV